MISGCMLYRIEFIYKLDLISGDKADKHRQGLQMYQEPGNNSLTKSH